MGPSKPRKMKETAKQNRKGDQGSPSNNKNIKYQDRSMKTFSRIT